MSGAHAFDISGRTHKAPGSGSAAARAAAAAAARRQRSSMSDSSSTSSSTSSSSGRSDEKRQHTLERASVDAEYMSLDELRLEIERAEQRVQMLRAIFDLRRMQINPTDDAGVYARYR